MVVPAAVLAWVEAVTGHRVARWARLPGASSTAVHRLVLDDGTTVVLRRYVWPGFLDDEPIAPQREVDVLGFLAASTLSAPSLIAADVDGSVIGDGIPALLMSRLGGRPIAVPDPVRLAEAAASVHATSADGLGHSYFRWYDRDTPRPVPARSGWPELWEAAFALWCDGMPAYRPMLTHRDFHPGNVLWTRGQLSGIVDWANACRGPAGCDVAHCSANLIALAGPAAATEFVAAYEAITGEQHHPFWEVASVLENEPATWDRRLASDEARLATALDAVGALPRRR